MHYVHLNIFFSIVIIDRRTGESACSITHRYDLKMLLKFRVMLNVTKNKQNVRMQIKLPVFGRVRI